MSALLLFLIACTKRETVSTNIERPRAIIIISVDTLRSDRLPAYGYTGITTPNIDRLRDEGVLFRRAYAHIPLTLPSHATIFTGVLPAATGLRDNAGFRMEENIPTMAALLGKAGFKTVGVVSAYSLRAASGISRGFDMWDDKLERTGDAVMGEVQRRGSDSIAVAKQWITANGDAPFFLFLHLYEPHTPYAAPEPWASRYTNAYDAEVAYSDALVGEFVDFLRERKIYDDAAIFFLSDHGEGLGDHGEDEHGILLYRESIQVPLIVKLPKSASKGSYVDAPVQMIDVMPAVMSLAGIDFSPSHNAMSLLEGIHGRIPLDRPIFAESYFPRLHLGWSEQHSIVRASRHLMDGPKVEMYDILNDPAERNDLAASERRERAALLEQIKPLARPADPTVAIDSEEARKLTALGYIGSAASSSGPLPDPKVEIEKFRQVRQALWFFQHDRFEEAVAATDPLLESNARMLDVWDTRARSLTALGRNEEALSAARRALTLFPGDASMLILVSQLSLRMGRHDDAAEHARLAVAKQPAEAHEMLARIALDRGDARTALAEAQLAENAKPQSPGVEWLRGRVALAQQRLPQALAHFDRALTYVEQTKMKPQQDLHGDRGFVLAVMGRSREAEAAFKEELRLYPANGVARENLKALHANSRGRN